MLTNFDIFGVYNIETFSIPSANKIFPCHCSFTYLLLWLICGIINSSQQMSLQSLSTNNNYCMVFSDEGNILIKSLYLKTYTAKRLTDEFTERSWTKNGINKLLKKSWDTGTVHIAHSHQTQTRNIHLNSTVAWWWLSTVEFMWILCVWVWWLCAMWTVPIAELQSANTAMLVGLW